MNAASGLDGLEPLNHCLDAESTRRVVAFRVDPPVQARIPFLGKRANEGALDETERPEYDALSTRRPLIAILKAKVRPRLGTRTTRASARARR